ncbi:LAFE_0A01640g1_1 [Lachancea fermentati]|uniref:Conserved oligomeric Golgi complex subunit 8 n=1 Tax=Lachancea fermentati TaxID=4955 RepID=A0A1G4M6E6_LACFM|nr:LAFE_0A01640g1_1 [Lachancea fermentati]
MDVLLDDLAGCLSDSEVGKSIMSDVLQSRTTYEDYFSSQPQPGSIVEDIAEVEAEISTLERQLRGILTDHKDELFDLLLKDPIESQLSSMLLEMDQLWELEKKEAGLDSEGEADKDNTGLDITDGNDTQAQEDAFHVALEKLKRHASKTASEDDGLAVVLANLSSVNEILELPALVATCVKTGHYQEALMCHSHARGLILKFPNVGIVQELVSTTTKEVTTTMLQGLVKLLSTNLSVNAMKKIVTYLSSIPPFSDNRAALLQVFLTMRYQFVCSEIKSYQIDEISTQTITEMLVKRKIEVVREHVYSSLVVFPSMFDLSTEPVVMPLFGEKKPPIATNVSLLVYVEQCTDALLSELLPHKSGLSDSVCLQLVYCAFRLADSNQNYYHLFLNKIWESGAFSLTQLQNAMEKRRELASKYY